MYAVISDRGRQQSVREGDVIQCDTNTDWKEGETVTFDHVLLLADEGEVRVGAPAITGARVQGTVLGTAMGEKLVVFQFKRRKGVRRKRGHRQAYTQVRITSIQA